MGELLAGFVPRAPFALTSSPNEMQYNPGNCLAPAPDSNAELTQARWTTSGRLANRYRGQRDVMNGASPHRVQAMSSSSSDFALI